MPLTRAAAIQFVVFLGVVSLFADMTYEGARSVTGPFFAHLGASGTVVGIVAGLGELVGYGLRLVSGYLSDRTKNYWGFALAGYAANLGAVPALALTRTWPAAAGLLLVERAGRAVRKPARDAMLSHAGHTIGRGWGFGLHEAMDQTGALIGPLLVALVLHQTGRYQTGFTVLLVPGLLSYAALLVARRFYPRPSDLEPTRPELASQGLPPVFWGYLAAAALVAAGYSDFALISFRLAQHSVVAPAAIPILYAAGMGMAAVSALVCGRLFDRAGLSVVVVATAVAACFAPLVFFGGPTATAAGMLLWGIGVGVQESALRAAVADVVPASRRAAAYGIFDTGFGVAWFAGSAVMGILYDRSLGALVGFSLAAQLLSVPVFMWSAGRAPRAATM